MIITFDQAIGSTIKYELDWADDLKTGETIATSIFVVGPEVVQTFAAVDGTVCSVYIENGTGVINEIYEITNRVTVDNPDGHQRELDEFTFRVRLVTTLYR